MLEEQFFEILNRELVVAMGCTEPIAIVIAAAHAKKHSKGSIKAVNVKASRNIVKNAFSVKIPGTDDCGINLAAALGMYIETSEINMELLEDVKVEEVDAAKKMVEDGLVSVELADTPKKLYVEVTVKTDRSISKAVVEDFHDNVALVEVDGTKLDIKNPLKPEKNDDSMFEDLTLDEILRFIKEVETDKLVLIKQSIDLNSRISFEGINNCYGIKVGKNIKTNIGGEIIGNDICNQAVALTASGSDARMAGCNLPVMTNSGSGNQGISATMPVVVFAAYVHADVETLIRAVALSNLITIYIKSSLGRLSALCGATVASAGSCCGITYLMGGNNDQIKSALQNILGNVTGIICDGAKAGCALKVATCTTAAIQSVICVMEGQHIQATDGIVEEDPEDTIKNFCKIGQAGMAEADRIILEIMMDKSNKQKVHLESDSK
ncbi:MAG: serine dehydratase subunit alpha family protein [Methanobacterium sp.]|nr:serine dehydratase subunit alpha family protein [Methanobacterium sp.]